jgi:midasin (ATPase involved in ribosome maturation)
VCQLLALMRATHLHVLNCNQHTETSDFLGGFRPTRTRDRCGVRVLLLYRPLTACICLSA